MSEHVALQKLYPNLSPSDVNRLVRYRRGDAYTFDPPTVCTALWSDLAWSRWVTFTHTQEA